jgi:hypothetical protein
LGFGKKIMGIVKGRLPVSTPMIGRTAAHRPGSAFPHRRGMAQALDVILIHAHGIIPCRIKGPDMRQAKPMPARTAIPAGGAKQARIIAACLGTGATSPCIPPLYPTAKERYL